MPVLPAAIDVAKQTLLILTPELLLLVIATAMMTAGAFVKLPRRSWAAIATGSLLLAALALFLHHGFQTDLYASVALNDTFSVDVRAFFLFAGLILLGLGHDQVDETRAAEFFGSLLVIQAGAMIVATANELVYLFVGLELVSIPTYLLFYLCRRSQTTTESATKYFFLSIFSSGLLLFGMAYLYGLTGITNLKALSFMVARVAMVPNVYVGLIGVLFALAGLGFRVAAVPFHFYAPDVYQGSPTFLTAVLAWVPKGVGFVAMIRLLTATLSPASIDNPLISKAVIICWVVSALSMTLGNLVALLQDNLKRMFAYSGIAHAGYLMLGIMVAFANRPGTGRVALGTEAVLFYLVAYALMTLGALGVLIALSTTEKSVETIDDVAGLSTTHPWLAAAMAVCLFSLAGIPPLAGFWGKLYLFGSAFSAIHGEEVLKFQVLVVIAVLNSAAGAYYYLRVIVAMYYRPVLTPNTTKVAWPAALSIGACAILSLVFGILPGPIAKATRASAEAAVYQPAPLIPDSRKASGLKTTAVIPPLESSAR